MHATHSGQERECLLAGVAGAELIVTFTHLLLTLSQCMHIQAAGVAYGIQSYIDQNSKFLESRVYKTQGLNHLLANYGAEVRYPGFPLA